jgi:hypothetical protein
VWTSLKDSNKYHSAGDVDSSRLNGQSEFTLSSSEPFERTVLSLPDRDSSHLNGHLKQTVWQFTWSMGLLQEAKVSPVGCSASWVGRASRCLHTLTPTLTMTSTVSSTLCVKPQMTKTTVFSARSELLHAPHGYSQG